MSNTSLEFFAPDRQSAADLTCHLSTCESKLAKLEDQHKTLEAHHRSFLKLALKLSELCQGLDGIEEDIKQMPPIDALCAFGKDFCALLEAYRAQRMYAPETQGGSQ